MQIFCFIVKKNARIFIANEIMLLCWKKQIGSSSHSREFSGSAKSKVTWPITWIHLNNEMDGACQMNASKLLKICPKGQGVGSHDYYESIFVLQKGFTFWYVRQEKVNCGVLNSLELF